MRVTALRCRARVLGDRDAALADARAVARPDARLQELIPLLESGQVPDFSRSSGSAGQFEVELRCEPRADCPLPDRVQPRSHFRAC